MTLIDTSSLVHFLRRKGDSQVKQRVKALLLGGEVATCDMVAVELFQGVGSEQDQQQIDRLTKNMIWLPTNDAVWKRARQLATQCRQAGTPVPASDILIAACAHENGAELDFEDAHFETLLAYR
jgi:hypothetical protein